MMAGKISGGEVVFLEPSWLPAIPVPGGGIWIFFRTSLERDIPQLGLSIPLDRNMDVLSLDDVLNMFKSHNE